MSHIINTLVLLSCIGLSSTGPAMATADGPDFFSVTGVAADDVLNIRAMPAATGALIATIPSDGDGIVNLGCIGEMTLAEWEAASEAERATASRQRWCRVGYDRTIGWVAGWFLTEGGTVDQFRAGGALSSMAGSEWVLRDFAGEPARAESWIGFRSDNAVGGNGGCNSFNGTYIPGQDAPLFSPLAATRKMCPGDQMETEMRMFQVLGEARQMVSYHLVMALFDGSGSLLATFTRRDPD